LIFYSYDNFINPFDALAGPVPFLKMTAPTERMQEPDLHTLKHDCVAICFNIWHPALSTYRQASIISLAHLTSWCTERIASATLQLCPNDDGEVTGKEKERITPERVWDLYMSWRRLTPLDTGQMEDIEESMRRLIHALEFVNQEEKGKEIGLARTPRPVSGVISQKIVTSMIYSLTFKYRLRFRIPNSGFQVCVGLLLS
jgi:hypothetical protein